MDQPTGVFSITYARPSKNSTFQKTRSQLPKIFFPAHSKGLPPQTPPQPLDPSRYNSHGKGAQPKMSQPQPARKPSSARRVAASRANGRLSHGPKTDAGKRHSCANNHKHGLANNRFSLLPSESEAAFLDLRARFTAGCHPRDAREQTLVDSMVASIWLLDRAQAHYKLAMDAEIDRQDPALSPVERASLAFSNLCHATLAAAHRYEVKYHRRFNRAHS